MLGRLSLLILPATTLFAEVVDSGVERFRVETVIDGLAHPWAIVELPDGGFLITERGGRLLRLDKPGAKQVALRGVPAVFARGQGGLLDVALHPDHAENGWVYLAFSKPIDGGAHTAVVRGKIEDDRFTSVETIYDPPGDQADGRSIHFGCRLVFDGRGNLFFSIGDRGGPTAPDNAAQDLGKAAGKIHRVRDDGSIPPDNPFLDTPGALPTIWAYGTRNAQGLVYDRATNRLWETEHGPLGGDELNLIRKGANLGWPLATHGKNYNGTVISEHRSLPGMDDPVVVWTPVIAASGLALYRGDKFPRWRGNLFAGGLASERLVRIELDGTAVTRQEALLKGTGRIRDVRAFSDGLLYVVYDEPGKVVRLVPAD